MSPETKILFSFALVATVSAGDRRPLLLAVGFLLPTTHGHRKLRGDRHYYYWDIKRNALG